MVRKELSLFDQLRRLLASSLVLCAGLLPAASVADEELAAQPVLRDSLVSAARKSGRSKDKIVQWESKKYPLIRWKAHPVTVVPGATGQLTTSFDPKEDVLRRGTLKYSMKMSELPAGMPGIAVQLLDVNGFKLTEFEILRDQFHPVSSNTSSIEAAGDTPCKKADYQQARDYVIKQCAQY